MQNNRVLGLLWAAGLAVTAQGGAVQPAAEPFPLAQVRLLSLIHI